MWNPKPANGWLTRALNALREEHKTIPATFTPHDVRHPAASLAVSSGAKVKVLQRMLGHASAAMTLDTYTDLFDDDLDDVAARLDHKITETIVGKKWAKWRANKKRTPASQSLTGIRG
ncbi:hypothetical protein GCM10022198_13070 [Klugiella xanthotipulae]|uniref:tyrosine-type recombinase/integrase n=1 Tax=Klugiella xanthotipulae TaxID=244735 RepID=UPI00319DC759